AVETRESCEGRCGVAEAHDRRRWRRGADRPVGACRHRARGRGRTPDGTPGHHGRHPGNGSRSAKGPTASRRRSSSVVSAWPMALPCWRPTRAMSFSVSPSSTPRFDGLLAWLAFLHVSRPHRRRGVASALWNEAVDLALAAGAGSLYVSAVPTG